MSQIIDSGEIAPIDKPEWGHSERVQAIQNALASMPHNQTPVGIGFKLTHSPTNCLRCRADIALLEISTILQSEV